MSNIGFNRDWFKRKEEDAYSFYNKKDELFDWDDEPRSSYSSYFVRDNQNLKTAANMVGSMFKVMNVTKQMKLTPNIEQQRSNQTTIHVPLAMLKGEDGEYKNHDTKLLDAFYGAAIQNAALATMQGQGDYARTVNAMSSNTKTTPKDLLFTILNTERVNKKLSERFPGYSKFVQKYKQHKFDENYVPLPAEEHEGKRLLELITKFLRYPAHITEEDMKEFEKPLTQIEKYVKKHGFPTTSAACEQQASYMHGVVKKYIKDEEEEPEEDGSCPNPGPTADELNELSKSLMQQMMSGEPGEDSEEFEEEFQDFTDDMDEKNAPPKKHNYDGGGNAEDSKIKFIKPEVDKAKYQKELKEIDTCKASVLAQLFARKCKDFKFAMKSMRSGRLDTNKIAEAKQNVPTIYERFGEVKTNKLNIGVLVDESGSMDGPKIKKARQAAIFLYEVFKKVPDARVYIYGHTADGGGGGTYGDTMIRTYVEHGKGINGYTLGNISARHNNRDGHAIYAVAKKIRSMNEDPCLLFVISDGAPYASGYDGQMAIDDTRKKVLQAQALGFQVIQIAIEEHVPCEEMFDYYIKMTNIKNLPNDIIAYVSKRVDKLIKSKTVM